MADINTITLNGAKYDIKDDTACTELLDKLTMVTVLPSTPSDGQVVLYNV